MATSTATTPAQAPQARPALPRRPGKRGTHRLWFTLGLATLSTLVAAGFAWRLSMTSPLRVLELKTYDLRFVLRGKQTPPPQILLVMIDAKTENAVPEPRVFWHSYYAKLLRAAAAGGARAVGMDLFFGMSVEKWLPDADRDLAAAYMEVSASLPVVLAYDTLRADQQTLPLYLFAGSQDAMGFANVTLDPDGLVRRQELQDQTGAGESFAARLASFALNSGKRAVTDRQQRLVRFGDRATPLDRSGFMMIHYWGPSGTFPSVSMADVLGAAGRGDRAQLERWFRDKIILVGTTDPADMRTTPFYRAADSQTWNTPGVEIHANTLATILERRFLREVSPAVAALLLFGAAALAAGFTFVMRFPLAPLALLATVATYLGVAARFQQAGLVLPVVAPLLAAMLGGFASYGAYSLTEGRQRRLLQDVFGRYVSRDIARELLAYGGLPLSGTRQEITVMFSDLRNYTHYCQGRDPHLVVEELNEYFAQMTAEIKAHGGMVNKFIGDGIMALFGAPVPHPDDPLRAVRCALRMVTVNEEYNQQRRSRGLVPLVIGIGLHTGDAVVGNIGAPEKLEYTAIGDTVNVASRIEGENKTYATRLLISEVTYQRVREQVFAELAGHAHLKGVDQPVALYKIIELKGGLS